MKLIIKKGTTSKRQGIFIQDSSSTVGAGLTGLLFSSSGLTFYYWREDEGNVNATSVTLVTATRGTYASGGFIEKDATNMPGAYEISIPNAALATGANWVIAFLKGATNMAPVVLEIQLVDIDVEDSVRAGLTALPNAAAEAAGGLYTRGTGAGQINQDANGRGDANIAATNNIALSAQQKADVNAEAVDVMSTDIQTEESQGLPPLTPTYKQILMWLYMTWRNDSASTSTERRIKNDAGTVVAKGTLADDATTFTQGKLASGP